MAKNEQMNKIITETETGIGKKSIPQLLSHDCTEKKNHLSPCWLWREWHDPIS
jgi:hypothetical protein